MSHTPGPWMWSEDLGLSGLGNATDPAAVMWWDDYEGLGFSGRHEVRTANARLIAAAPELLEALQMVLAIMCDKELCGHFLPSEIREVAEPAIAKAEGK